MAEEPEVVCTPEEEGDEIKSSYKPPPEKTIEEILAADQEDESLRKYKEALLGQAQQGTVVVGTKHLLIVRLYNGFRKAYDEKSTTRNSSIIGYANDPRKVIVKKLALCVAGRDDVELDLTGDLTDLKKQVFVLKEGIQYRIRIDFIVQREIVHGLKYVQKTYRMGVPVDKMTHMVGSYPPKTEIQSYTTPPEDAPSGMMARGSYSVNSLFTDDDKNVHLQWEWSFEIKKDWKD